jgi:hypothetical protein
VRFAYKLKDSVRDALGCFKSRHLLLLGTIMLSSQSLAVERSFIQEELRVYRDDPRSYMDRLPPKRNALGKVQADRVFLNGEEHQEAFLKAKDQFRLSLLKASGEKDGALSRIELPRDDPKRLVDNGLVIDRLEEMESQQLKSFKLDVQPWSADYWPMANGSLGSRFADHDFPQSFDWKANFDYISERPASQIIESGDLERINLLSPSEKYDLIVGDDLGLLTKRMWADGARYFEKFGEVEAWFGVCHGWAAASYMMDRPENAIRVPAKNHDFEITLYPSEIMALSSLLWSNVRTPTRLIGGRCNEKEPESDPETGRIIAQECFDNNPGAWHQTVVSQLGVAKRSMIIDVAFDYQVWNQPVLEYNYRYFNPKTNEEVETLEEATVLLSEFEEDRFKKFRDKDSQYLVGVAMEIVYLVEIPSNRNPVSVADDDQTRQVVYLYDLELDSDKKIIGGEWYNNYHPDFIWTPAKDARARTFAEMRLNEAWQLGKKVPDSWQRVAHGAASVGQPLGLIVEGLIHWSNSRPALEVTPFPNILATEGVSL